MKKFEINDGFSGSLHKKSSVDEIGSPAATFGIERLQHGNRHEWNNMSGKEHKKTDDATTEITDSKPPYTPKKKF